MSRPLIFRWQKAVLATRYSALHKVVAMALTTYANADGTRITAGVDRIAADASVGERTVQRVTSDLLADGWLVLVRRGRRVRGKGQPNEYRLCLPAADGTDANAPSAGALAGQVNTPPAGALASRTEGGPEAEPARLTSPSQHAYPGTQPIQRPQLLGSLREPSTEQRGDADCPLTSTVQVSNSPPAGHRARGRGSSNGQANGAIHPAGKAPRPPPAARLPTATDTRQPEGQP